MIDDEESIRKLLKRVITLEGYIVFDANSLKRAYEILKNEQIDVILSDVRLSDGNGIDYINAIKSNFPDIEVIMLTAYGNIESGIQAIKNGAYNYIIKGEDNNRILPLLAEAIVAKLTKKRNSDTRQKFTKSLAFTNIIGNTAAIRTVIEMAKKVSLTNATVLLLGETGTGKEVFANAIHNHSTRPLNKFLPLNCSAFNSELLESELFGHVSGAFTGAFKEKKGLLEEACDGTLFLDEIGDMPYDLQSKLLRVLETGEFIRVGDTKTTKVNVRIIAATNRDLKDAINEGRFREDLYYRINSFTIVLPPLRDRIDDISIFANHFLQYFIKKMESNVIAMSKDFINLLEQQQWNGNIREIKNVIERAMIVATGPELTVDDLPLGMQTRVNYKNACSAFELANIEKANLVPEI